MINVCSTCGLPAKWTFISGELYEWCEICSQQLELEIDVAQPTSRPEWNLSPDSVYVEHERELSGPPEEGLPF